jgi:hypothetical protein
MPRDFSIDYLHRRSNGPGKTMNALARTSASPLPMPAFWHAVHRRRALFAGIPFASRDETVRSQGNSPRIAFSNI